MPLRQPLAAFATVLIASFISTGCTYDISEPRTYASEGVDRLYAYPPVGTYQNLGLHSWGFYHPGFVEPTVSMVWSDISDKVREKGGNACIIRHESLPGPWYRSVEVTCEVLKVN